MKRKNAATVFKNLKKKNKEDVSKDDLIPVILTPLMEGKMTQMERVKQGFTVLGQEYSGVPREDIKRMQAVLYILADKFLTRSEMEEVKEVCRMKSLLQELWEEGIQQGKANAIVDLLNDIGTIASDLSARILGEKNEDTLRRWLKLATKAESVEQFVEKM